MAGVRTTFAETGNRSSRSKHHHFVLFPLSHNSLTLNGGFCDKGKPQMSWHRPKKIAIKSEIGLRTTYIWINHTEYIILSTPYPVHGFYHGLIMKWKPYSTRTELISRGPCLQESLEPMSGVLRTVKVKFSRNLADAKWKGEKCDWNCELCRKYGVLL